MKIQVFAILKDYFDSEFALDTLPENISELKEVLCKLNPEAEAVLDISRFAVQDEFIESDYRLQANDTIIIIPPSSGG